MKKKKILTANDFRVYRVPENAFILRKTTTPRMHLGKASRKEPGAAARGSGRRGCHQGRSFSLARAGDSWRPPPPRRGKRWCTTNRRPCPWIRWEAANRNAAVFAWTGAREFEHSGGPRARLRRGRLYEVLPGKCCVGPRRDVEEPGDQEVLWEWE